MWPGIWLGVLSDFLKKMSYIFVHVENWMAKILVPYTKQSNHRVTISKRLNTHSFNNKTLRND